MSARKSNTNNKNFVNIAKLILFVLALHGVYSHQHGHQGINQRLSPKSKVTYASVIKLKHHLTNFMLHSHDIRMGRGGVFSVTAYRNDDHGSYWQILEQHPRKTKIYSDTVKCGDSIMLASSIMNYLLRAEDTVFGLTTDLIPLVHGLSYDQIDGAANWNLHCVDKETGQDLYYGDKIRLKHDITGKYVATDGSSYYTQFNCGRGCEIVGQLQLHAIDNGANSQDAIFQITGGLSFDQTQFQTEKQTIQVSQ